MEENNLGILARFLDYNRGRVYRLRRSRKTRWLFSLSPRLRTLYEASRAPAGPEQENLALAAVVNAYEDSLFWRAQTAFVCFLEDARVFFSSLGKRKVIDRSDPRKKDYYSVAVIVKNEARYLREFLLFYEETGADRVYLYDNDSTDNLLEVLAPFLERGFVVYRRWPGHTVQAAAYRDAVRRTRRRTTWLALIDADEFLFSPKGPMPEQLKAYEQYPAVGANWLMFGPCGHEKRPEGLVMDAYDQIDSRPDYGPNCHIKSIVRPKEVFTVFHPHYAVYRRGRHAVGEDGVPLDNRSTRAFSLKNNREIFRINHYCTKSLEDLRAKCAKGRADGSPNADYEGLLRQFEGPQVKEDAIKPYADRVRKRYGET